MSTDQLYELKEPTSWAQPPSKYSISALQELRACPRRWQLTRSGWGQHSRFPERPQPATIEGQIIHEALDLLSRELGLHGRPPIGSSSFREAVERCGFWNFFHTRVDDWNRHLTSHPRAGPLNVLRTKASDLANQAVCLFRKHYLPGGVQPVDAKSTERAIMGTATSALLQRLLQTHGALSEVRLEHPWLPLVGVVDLVMLEQDASTTVIDFKTGDKKPVHEEQILLYGLLWWRVTGNLPSKVVVQYLDFILELSPTKDDFVTIEKVFTDEINQAIDVLSARPASAKPGQDCIWCTVRARCNEGWAWVERTSPASVNAKSVDVQLTVSSAPTPTGFLGTSPNGVEVAIVFDAAVGYGLPTVKLDDRFRIVGASLRQGGKEIVLLPWTEMYRL